MGEELDVWKCWDSSFGFFLYKVPFALFKSSIGAARLLGLFAANYSLGVFLSLQVVRVVRATWHVYL